MKTKRKLKSIKWENIEKTIFVLTLTAHDITPWICKLIVSTTSPFALALTIHIQNASPNFGITLAHAFSTRSSLPSDLRKKKLKKKAKSKMAVSTTNSEFVVSRLISPFLFIKSTEIVPFTQWNLHSVGWEQRDYLR